ncbi:MAG: agmatine deiminase family protein [Candidatus Omnitrophica bacterium]|nr:agmatine deiminase family protein [Candidatus Omnitrophota bacterium]
MPPEWTAHEATWLAWPHNLETWPGGKLAEVEKIYLAMIEALLPHEKVKLLVKDQNEKGQVLIKLKAAGLRNLKNLILIQKPTVDAWIRDYGPTFVTNRPPLHALPFPEEEGGGREKKAYIKWIFNGWGNKYPSFVPDTRVFEDKDLIPDRGFEAGFVLEGGSIEVNGEGICMTTESCLLNKNRNPQFSQKEIEENLRKFLGVSEILWLNEGIAGDDTDGHIDDLARFVAPKVILAAVEEDSKDGNYSVLKKNWEILKRAASGEVKRFDILEFPMPGGVVNADNGERLPASYTNFYLANGVVLLPVYRHKNDERAIKILKEFFPRHLMVPIDCNALVYGLGALHCVTQQEPVV